MPRVCRQILNESNNPGLECKHKFRKAVRTVGSFGGMEKRGAERPAETLSGTFGAGSFCDARQHVDLADVNFPYLIKQILSRESCLQILPHFISDSPTITLPSLALNSHCCSSSSLIPYFSRILFLFSVPVSLLVSLSNHPGVCTANMAEYPVFLRATFFPHFYFCFEKELTKNFGTTILSLLIFQP